MKTYSDLFKGVGCFETEYKIQLKEDAQPIAYAPRRVPHAIKNKLKEKLDELVKRKIIEKANGYNEWVNHLVTVEKKDKEKSLRLCLDPQKLNSCIADEHRTVENELSQFLFFFFFVVACCCVRSMRTMTVLST